MVGGGQIQKVDAGLNSEARGWIASQQSGDPFGEAHGQGPFKRPFSHGFGDPTKVATSLDINYREHHPRMEQRAQQEGGGEGTQVEQRGVYGPQLGQEQEWSQGDRVGVESNYQEMAGVGGDLSESDGSQSEGTEEEEDEEDEDVEDDDDDDEDEDDPNEGDIADNEVHGGNEKGGQVVTEQVGGVSSVSLGPSLPLLHSSMGALDQSGQVRQEPVRADGAFHRNTSKPSVGTTGTSNSPFGMFHSPSSTVPFLSSFPSPSNSTPQTGVGGHTDVTPCQNGSGGGVTGSASGASYCLARDGGLSRDVTREGLRESAVVTPLQETPRRPQEPLHEQLQTSDNDNYYTTLLNTQVSPNNGMKRTDSASGPNGDPQSTAESSLRRILSDPLTGALMDDAMIISCGHSVGNAGRKQVMETSVCIICGASVRTEAMAPNYALRMVVQAFKREEEINGTLSLRSAKRRRETIQENVSFPEQPVVDVGKVKGVQFPFVVGDQVMIKGNKRTPERFVGREAVITIQCLNGWYLVRTLDSGESVRLQYRSLQKVAVIYSAEVGRSFSRSAAMLLLCRL
ncbi:uncharacterized protein [Physcomitrium patens]|uniref:PUB 62/63 C-terminal domain-containing protein n=1 Tax=Physcomitrium patens TaxID=3218 RepID=A0A7I4AME0_PHYPA